MSRADDLPTSLPVEAAEARLLDSTLLVPGLVHEARHPLMGIRAGLELLAQALGPAATSLEDWQLVLGQMARLEEIFGAYQEFIAPEDVRTVAFAVGPVVHRAADLVRYRARPLGSRFAVVIDPALPAARGAPRALLHALTNLLMNALDAVDGAPGPARVEVRALPAPGAPARVQIRVANGGCGIAPEAREHLFEPRFTTKGARGSGLGLHTARRMIEACGGTVRLVDGGDAAHRPWATTELAIELPAEVNP